MAGNDSLRFLVWCENCMTVLIDMRGYRVLDIEYVVPDHTCGEQAT